MAEMFNYRVLCTYEDKELIGCFLLFSDGKYINRQKKIYFGHNPDLDERYDLFLNNVRYALKNKKIVTESKLKELVSDRNIRFGVSTEFGYKYIKRPRSIFNTILRNNGLVEIDEGDD
jgi:hypothetical protein